MPELPEVETVVRQLAPLAVGRRIRSFTAFDPLLRILNPELVLKREITGISRCGKQILIALGARRKGDAPVWMAIHLRMTGRLLWKDSVPLASKPVRPAPVRAVWKLDRGAMVFFDTRRFGTIRILDSLEQAAPVGVDPTSPEFDGPALHAMTRKATTAIKAWLLRQDRLVGMGNIYASEACFGAKIHPARPAGSLTKPECVRLVAAVKHVLERSIAAGGTTFSDFQNARGDVGKYQFNLDVYDREGEPCPRCGKKIVRIVQAQRSTYYCPSCQRMGRSSS